VGAGASGRSSGILTPLPERRWATKLSADGRDVTLRAGAFQSSGVATAVRLITEGGIACDLDGAGYLIVGDDEEENQLRAEAAAMIDLGLQGRIVKDSELQAMFPMTPWTLGVEGPARWIQPARYVYGLCRLARQRGARVVEAMKVTTLEPGLPSVIRSGEGVEVTAGTVVIATNAFTPRLGILNDRVYPFLTCAVATEPIHDAAWERIGWRGGHAIFEGSPSTRFTFVRSPSGRLVCRGGLHASDVNLAAVEDELAQAIAERFPPAARAAITHCWCGLVGVTRSLRPLIGRLPIQGEVLHALAYAGHGLAAASLAGRLLAELFLGESSPELEYALTA